MFKIIQNILFGGNTHWCKAVKLVDSTLEWLESELNSEYQRERYSIDPCVRFLIAQRTAIVHQQINTVNELWKAFNALSEPTVDDLENLKHKLIEITSHHDVSFQLVLS